MLVAETKYQVVTDNVTTGILAREERVLAGHTLRAMAKRMRISASYLSELELGRRSWSRTIVTLFNASL